jgi:hypothetical protein
MNSSLKREIDAWEGEGETTPRPLTVNAIPMSGTANQVEWAESIKHQVNDEFARVTSLFRSIADRQHGERRADTEAIIAILDDKRAEAMSAERASYFIRDWQEITDQVRQMLLHDSRYLTIKSRQADKTASKHDKQRITAS